MQLVNMMWNATWLAEDPQVGNCVTFAWHLIIIMKTTTLCDSRCFKHSLWLWEKSRTNVVQLPVVLRWHALSGFLCSLGQAGAIRLAISRALLSFEDSYLEPLQKGLRQCCYRAFSDVGLCHVINASGICPTMALFSIPPRSCCAVRPGCDSWDWRESDSPDSPRLNVWACAKA